jgi:predicted TIM-barrel fold metal-dependent hydrolase
MRILDTHLHLVDKARFSYPWLDDVPVLNHEWTAQDYFAEAVGLGIEAALHMEVDVAEAQIEAETAHMLTVHPRVIGAIAACRPEHTDFAAFLERVTAQEGVRGLRRILHTSPDALSQTPLFAENLRRLAATGLTFDFCVLARQLPLAVSLAKAAPDVQFVLDHCGVPDISGGAMESWRAGISAVAALPNVACKVSGIAAYAAPGWTADTLRPFVEHVIESFGWDRVVWGSDHPVVRLTADLTRWVQATKTIVSGASRDEQERLFHRNAERLYRVGA